MGWSYNRVGVTRAFWSSGNGMTDLGTLISSKNGASGAATAEAVNDAGLVVGSSQSTTGSGAIWHAVLWTTR